MPDHLVARRDAAFPGAPRVPAAPQPQSAHDPCQLVRRGGVIEQPRNLMKMVVKDFVEMEDPGKYNWCCGGGGGVSANANEEAEGLRLEAFKIKKRQLENTGAKTLVTACANCRITLEEGLEHNQMNFPVVGLTEMIAEHLVETPSAKS
jgi:Fe-S oxidoreductase